MLLNSQFTSRYVDYTLCPISLFVETPSLEYYFDKLLGLYYSFPHSLREVTVVGDLNKGSFSLIPLLISFLNFGSRVDFHHWITSKIPSQGRRKENDGTAFSSSAMTHCRTLISLVPESRSSNFLGKCRQSLIIQLVSIYRTLWWSVR